MEKRFQMTFHPTWDPLEKSIGIEKCGEWMFMGTVKQGDDNIHLYKNINTREYKNLSDDGSEWIFAKDCYNKIPKNIPICATPDWWNDLYTDGAGNCFSDADPGL